MADPVYMVVPQVGEPINDNLTGRDEVPKSGAGVRDVGNLRAWVSTPMGSAYRAWAKAGPKWDVDDMGGEHVYSVGTGSTQIFWVPARWNGVQGPAGRYYWVPVKVVLDIAATGQAQADEIAAKAAADKVIADARAAALGAAGSSVASGSDPYSVAGQPVSSMGPAARQSGKELSLFDGPDGQIWYANTPSQSASVSQSPHPGIALAGPMVWDTATWGKPEDNGLPRGLRLVTMDDPADKTSIRSAGPEYQIVMARAQKGDGGALEVLRGLGVAMPASMMTQSGGVLDDILSWF